MEANLLVIIILVILSLIGLIVVTRPHPKSVYKRDVTTNRNGQYWHE